MALSMSVDHSRALTSVINILLINKVEYQNKFSTNGTQFCTEKLASGSGSGTAGVIYELTPMQLDVNRFITWVLI